MLQQSQRCAGTEGTQGILSSGTGCIYVRCYSAVVGH